MGFIIGLAIGGLAGWLWGSYQTIQSINAQIAAQLAEESADPLEDVSTNPLENVSTNPYENVKTNPFE